MRCSKGEVADVFRSIVVRGAVGIGTEYGEREQSDNQRERKQAVKVLGGKEVERKR